MFVDADHAHDVAIKESVTAITLFLDNIPVRRLSKRQRTLETTTWRSELVKARVARRLIMEVRYTLRMMECL